MPEKLHDIGWEEYFDGEAICLVEWPDRAEGCLPSDCIEVMIELAEEPGGTSDAGPVTHRRIRIQWNGGQA